MRHYHSYITLFLVSITLALLIGCGRREADDTSFTDDPPATQTPVTPQPEARDRLSPPVEIVHDEPVGMHIYGSVIDATTELPLSDATVRIRWTGIDRSYIKSVQTDHRGAFSFSHQHGPRVVHVAAMKKGYIPLNARWNNEKLTLALTPGETVRVSGTVIDDRQDAVSGAIVHLRAQQRIVAQEWRDALAACTAQTDAQGRFALPAVPANLEELFFHVQHEDFPPHNADDSPFTTHDGDVELVIVLPRGITVRGSVTFPSGSPLPHADVWAEYVTDRHNISSPFIHADRQHPIPRAQTVTGEDGSFILSHIPTTRPFIIKCVIHPFPVMFRGPWRDGDLPRDEVHFVVPDTLGRLVGSLTDEAGQPVTNVQSSYVMKATGEDGRSYGVPHPLRLDIDEDGSYVSDLLAPASYEFTFHASRTFPVSHTQRIAPQETHILDVTFASVPVITGIVKDAATDLPLAGVTHMDIQRVGGKPMTTNVTDQSGHFYVYDTYATLTFTHPDYAPVTESFHSQQDTAPSRPVVYLSSPASVRVIARMSDGTPATNMNVWLMQQIPGRQRRFQGRSHEQLQEDGTCVFTNLPSHVSPVTAQIRHRGMMLAESEPHELAPHTMREIPVTLPPFGALTLFFSEPVTGMNVRVNARHFFAGSFEQQPAEWHATHIATGTYAMSIFIEDHIDIRTNITIHPNRTTEFYVDLLAVGGIIEGMVTYDTGEPAECSVMCHPHGMRHTEDSYLHIRNAHTSDGAFTLRGLCERTRYDVRVMLPWTNILISAVIPNGPPLHIRLPRTYTLTGRLEDPYGEPAKARFMLRNYVTQSEGDFTIENVTMGTHTLYIYPEDYAPFTYTVRVYGDTDIGTIVLEEESVTLRGRVVTPDGTPVPHCHVMVMTQDVLEDRFINFARTENDGTFVLRGIPPHKTILLTVHHEGQQYSRELGAFPPGETDCGDIVLDPPGVIEITALKPDGSPAAGAYVNGIRLDENGRAALPEVPILLFYARQPDPYEGIDGLRGRTHTHHYSPTGAATNHITVTLPAHLWSQDE